MDLMKPGTMTESATRLPRTRSCAAIARRLAEERFADQLGRSVMDDLKLIVSELVDNAYLHGKGQIEIKLQRLRDRIRVEVRDEGLGGPIKIRMAEAFGRGNGLRLVDHLAIRWGAFDGSSHVWAELPIAA